MNGFKSIFAATAVFTGALVAHAASYISRVDPAAGSMGNEGNAYTVSELKSASDMSDYNLGTDRGWVAGIKLTWQNNQQNATQTTEEFGDSAGWRSQSSFTVYNNGDKTPYGSGLKNATTSTTVLWTTTYYNSTAEWYVYVTPEMMYQWSKNGVETYTATLMVKETNRDGWSNVTTPTVYTITIPTNLMLTDSEGVAWYPAVGLLGEKVYGEMQYLADQITADNYETVKFLNEPVGVEFTTGFAASANGDGTWGVVMTHSHDWHFTFADGVLTATCGNGGCPVNNGSTTLSLVLSDSDKDYDGVEITPSLVFGDGFESSFENAQVVVAVTKGGESVETISDIGEYTVTMTVTGLGDGETYTPTKTVTISPLDISSATLVLSPASTTYNGEEQTVSASVTVGNLAATIEVDAENSITAATEIGTYSVTVNGTGNFIGSLTGTWKIVNTTGSLSGVAATTSADAGSYADGTLTVTDTTALAYADGAWTAGLTLTWPVDKQDSLTSGHAHYVTVESAKVVVSGGMVSNSEESAKFRRNALSGEKQFTYLATTTWTVAITPAVIEAALAEEKAALEYTMRAGALVWGDSTEGDPDGVAFADYTITLSLDEPVEFVLGEGESYDLGDTELTTTKIQLAAGASVTCDVVQAEGLIYTEVNGYDVVRTEDGGKYVYTAQLTHQHMWNVSKAENGYELVATCANDECDINKGEVKMWLDVGVTEKPYDGNSVTRVAVYGDCFNTVYPDANVVLTVNGEENGVINDAGEYTVELTVTGVGEDTYTLSRTVTISKVDISEAELVLSPATTPYDGTEQEVASSVTVNNLSATIEVDAEKSTTAATEMGTYTVIVNGTGNFTGSTSATWSIVNTTGSLSGVTSAVSGIGDYDSENNTLTVTDSTALEYSDGAWYAGITLEWPVETKDWQALDWSSYAHYVTEDSVKISTESGEITHSASEGSYRSGVSSYPKFDYLASTTWKVAITPAVVESALSEEKTALEWTMRAGAIKSDTYANGVAFQDYTITLSLDEPVEFVLGEGESYDLGDTELTTTKIQLAAGASVTSSVEQTVADAIYTTETGYDVVCTEDGGKYVYTAKITHVHDWTYSVEGLTLTATCVAAECTVEGNATTVSLNLSSGDKVYDNKAITASADFDSSFKTIFPDAEATISTTKDGEPIDNDEIKDAGEYVVTMTVMGLSGGQSRDVSRNVTISKVDISEAALVLTPATTPYNGTEQEVTSSVTVNNLSATIEVDAEKSTTAATEMGTYTVIVNGTGNFTGSTSATWSIVNTTGAPTSVAASAAGSMTDVGNDFTLSDSSKLEYDPENKVWYAGITIAWPMSKTDYAWYVVYTQQGSAKYVTEESARITTEDGVITNVTATGSYRTGAAASTSKDFTYLSTTTWKVPLTPEIIEAAIAEEKTSLTYTMNAGAIVWGNETEGDTAGVKFEDYTITIPLEGITLDDENGKQVYPKTEGQTVIDEIKEEVETTNPDDKAKVEAKIDEVAKVAGEGKEQDVADWVNNMVNNMVEKGGTATTFFDALAESDYVKASFELGTETLITEDSEVEVAEFESTDGGFTFEVKIDNSDVEAARVAAASIIQSVTSLGDNSEFEPLAVGRINISEDGKITIIKDPNVDREFFKIVIDKDSAE